MRERGPVEAPYWQEDRLIGEARLLGRFRLEMGPGLGTAIPAIDAMIRQDAAPCGSSRRTI
jgi:hypothetical protein